MGKVVADMMNHHSGLARCFHSIFKADDSYKMTTVVSSVFRRKSEETVQRPKAKKILLSRCVQTHLPSQNVNRGSVLSVSFMNFAFAVGKQCSVLQTNFFHCYCY